LGLLGSDPVATKELVRQHARAIKGWLEQGSFSGQSVAPDASEWRSEQTLISPSFGIKGRADAIRRGMPVELKTGKNTNREPRFQDKVQAACYALMIGEHQARDANALEETSAFAPDTGVLLYTKNAALDRSDESGDLSPAKEFSIGKGLLDFVVRSRNALAAMEHDHSIPTGYEGDAKCEYCFEQDTCLVISGRLNQESKAGQVGESLPESERDYLETWYERIEGERRHVHREYRKLWEQDAEERVDDDRAIINLNPIEREQLANGRWRVHVQRVDDTPSKMQVGDVVLASDGDPLDGDSELVRIVELSNDAIVLEGNEPVEIRRLDVYPSELSVDRMLTALHDFVLKGDTRRKDVLFDRDDPEFADQERVIIDNNSAQNAAVNKVLNARDFALIHGPPGTGKTYTIARAIEELTARGDRVLLSAFTNRAVDNALEAVRDRGIGDVMRIGTDVGVRADMQDLRLQAGPDAAHK
ncbi:MAG: AAA domain-containing protein, partial [Halobacteriaceae archaeon]